MNETQQMLSANGEKTGCDVVWSSRWRHKLKPRMRIRRGHRERQRNYINWWRRLRFAEQGSTTLFTQTMVYESREARDAVLKPGMEAGVRQSYDRLEEMLARRKR